MRKFSSRLLAVLLTLGTALYYTICSRRPEQWLS